MISLSSALKPYAIIAGILAFVAPVYAANSATFPLAVQATVTGNLNASCPGSTVATAVNLGTFDAGGTPGATTVICTVRQNRRNGVMTITASPAANAINLTATGGSETLTINFGSYNFTSGTMSGSSFTTGFSITDPDRNVNDTFSYTATPAAIPRNQSADTYHGSHTLTFSLI